LDDLLRQIARREFGAGSEDAVLTAWKHFSEAIQVYPDTGPNWGSCNALAAPLFFSKPKPRAMTLDHSWSDQQKWSGRSQLDPHWPYVPSRLIFWPDFSNHRNAAEGYIGFFSVPVFQKYLQLAADRMEQGLQSYRRARVRSGGQTEAGVSRVLLAEQLRADDAASMPYRVRRYAVGVGKGFVAAESVICAGDDRVVARGTRSTACRPASSAETRGSATSGTGLHLHAGYDRETQLIDDTLDRQIPNVSAAARFMREDRDVETALSFAEDVRGVASRTGLFALTAVVLLVSGSAAEDAKQPVSHAHHRLDMAGRSGRGELGVCRGSEETPSVRLFWEEWKFAQPGQINLRAGLTVNRLFPTTRRSENGVCRPRELHALANSPERKAGFRHDREVATGRPGVLLH
jgi:hypothetical protein